MSVRKVIVVTVGVFVIPFALLAVGAARSGNLATLVADQPRLFINWLYMVAPHLLVLLIAAAIRSARQYFLRWSLIALSFALVAFQFWVWWWVPPRESALAWVLYIPLSAIVLVAAACIALWWRRFNKPLHPTAYGVG